MSDMIGQLMARYGFCPFSVEDAGLFQQYGTDTDFFDLSFTNFWTWGSHFHYVRKVLDGTLAVFYEGVGEQIACILLPGPSRNLRRGLERLYLRYVRVHRAEGKSKQGKTPGAVHLRDHGKGGVHPHDAGEFSYDVGGL